jgi:precorrin-8X/cobalt-precorrin-8 methylmutase
MKPQIETNPLEIAHKSFRIIEDLVDLSSFSKQVKPVIKRIIHTTGDIEFAQMSHLNDEAVLSGMKAIQENCNIITDVQMVATGINQKNLQAFDCKIHTAISLPEVEKIALEKNITRAIAAADYLKPLMNNAIVMCGNAPTFLYRIMEMIDAGEINPALVVAFPVGFVGAAESKEELLKYSDRVPVITNKGNKGGSAICSAVLNALVLNLTHK